MAEKVEIIKIKILFKESYWEKNMEITTNK